MISSNHKDNPLMLPRLSAHFVRLWVASCLGLATILLSFTSVARAHAETPEHVALLGAGSDAWRMGDIAEATRRWGEAIRICRLEGDPLTELAALAQRGEALAALGELRGAETDLKAGLDKARQLKMTATEAAIEGAIGNLAFQSQNLVKATYWFDLSIRAAQQAGAIGVLAASTNNRANLYAAVGALAAATQAYDMAARYATTADDGPLQGTIALNLARLGLRMAEQARVEVKFAEAERDRANAEAHLVEAARITRALPPSGDQILGLVAIVRLGLSMHSSVAAKESGVVTPAFVEALARQAMATSKTLESARAQSLAAGTLAEVMELSGRRDEAKTLDRSAIESAQRVDAKDLLWRWEWLNGRLTAASGDRSRAIGAYRRAKATLEEIRLDLPVNSISGRSSFREEIGPLYFGLADLLLTEADHSGTDSHAKTGLLSDSREAIEAFESYEVSNYLHIPCARPQVKFNAREYVGAKDAILYPILLPQRIEVLVSLPDGKLIHHSVPIKQVQAERVVLQFREALENGAGFDGPAQQLYDWIIRPIRDDLATAGVDTLVVVPDGTLRTIPFAALHDGHEYVVERLAVVTEPSIALIAPYTRRTMVGLTLLSGTSEELTFAGQIFPKLAGVDDELAALAGIMPTATLLKKANFTGDAMQHGLQRMPYHIVHIASHAVFGDTPEGSYFLTHDGGFSLDRLEESLKSTRLRDDPLEILVLSACKTAFGNDLAALGLAGVAVKAGARSAVGALWEVTDPVAATLMPRFYLNLADPSMTKAQALQQAQKYVLHQTNFRSPRFWAPFLLIGSGG